MHMFGGQIFKRSISGKVHVVGKSKSNAFKLAVSKVLVVSFSFGGILPIVGSCIVWEHISCSIR